MDAMQLEIKHVNLQSSLSDIFVWRWSSNGIFSVHSLYTWLYFGGVPNHDFDALWSTNMSLKINFFVWLVRNKKVLTKMNLAKQCWNGCTQCVFCDMDESVDHLFVSCPFINSIWQWIAQFNSFIFTGSNIQDLWYLDSCIPLKNKYVIEMVTGVVLWNV
jgi:zinc-binding in reverse transcriptase